MTLEAMVLTGLLVAVGLLAAAAAVRMLRTVGRTRSLSHFQASAAALARDLASAGDPLVRDLDDLRRRTTDPSVSQARLAAAMPTIRALNERARAGLHAPPGLEPLAAAMAGEVSRALRSAELAEMGLAAMFDRNAREAEGSTTLKRAALNLRNAIDESGRLAERIGRLRTADLERPGAVAGAVATATLPSYGADDDDLPIGS